MNDERITAIWEEDGDLMRLKEFFAYIHQNDELKARIKQKTLDKIISLPDTANIPEPEGISNSTTAYAFDAGDQTSRGKSVSSDNTSFGKTTMADKVSAKTKNKSIFSLLPSFKGYGKKHLKMLSAAAVLLFAVYLGSTGLLQDGFSPIGMKSSRDAAESNSGSQGLANTPKAAPAPASPPIMTGAMDTKAKEESGFAADSTYELKSRQNTVATAPNGGSDQGISPEIQQKIIYVMDASLKADDVTQSMKSIEEKVAAIGGYIAESRRNTYNNQVNAFLSIRVPAANFQSFKGELSNFGTVADEHLYTDDVSRQYFDVETRLRSWEAQERRYLEILQQAKTVEEILKIEDSLANVRREMESLKGQLKFWDQRVDYSEIRLNITSSQNTISVNDPWQPVSIKSTVIAAKNAVIKSISFLWNAINYILIFIGYAIPLIVIAGAGWLIYRSRKKK